MIHCKIVTPLGVYQDLEASMINIVSVNGQLGILPRHMPLVTMLKISEMSILTQNQKRERYAISGGMFYFENDEATILCDAIENENEIDLKRAVAAKERAEKRISANDPNIDLRRAELALSKALNRIRVKQ